MAEGAAIAVGSTGKLGTVGRDSSGAVWSGGTVTVAVSGDCRGGMLNDGNSVSAGKLETGGTALPASGIPGNEPDTGNGGALTAVGGAASPVSSMGTWIIRLGSAVTPDAPDPESDGKVLGISKSPTGGVTGDGGCKSAAERAGEFWGATKGGATIGGATKGGATKGGARGGAVPIGGSGAPGMGADMGAAPDNGGTLTCGVAAIAGKVIGISAVLVADEGT